jgi:hypothetical protein
MTSPANPLDPSRTTENRVQTPTGGASYDLREYESVSMLLHAWMFSSPDLETYQRRQDEWTAYHRRVIASALQPGYFDLTRARQLVPEPGQPKKTRRKLPWTSKTPPTTQSKDSES